MNAKKPDFAELIHLELDSHPDQVHCVNLLEVKTDFVAYFLAVEGRCGLLELMVIVSELLEVEFDLAVVLQKLFLLLATKTRRQKIECYKLAKTELRDWRQRYGSQRVPKPVVGTQLTVFLKFFHRFNTWHRPIIETVEVHIFVVSLLLNLLLLLIELGLFLLLRAVLAPFRMLLISR